jgi:hypothetical protein
MKQVPVADSCKVKELLLIEIQNVAGINVPGIKSLMIPY